MRAVQERNGKTEYRAWVVFAAAICINLTLGVNYSWSVFKKALVNDWLWTNVQASLPYTVYATIFSLVMVFAGRMQDRVGPRKVATLGGIIVGIGLISCSFTATPLLMACAYGLTGIGYSLAFSTTMPASVKWFPAGKKGMITGIVVSGSALASAYFSPLVNWLVGLYGIAHAFLVLGIGVSLVITVMAQFLMNPPDHHLQSESSGAVARGAAAAAAPREVDWRGMIRTEVFYRLWLMYFFTASAGLMIIGHIATIAQTQALWENGFYLIIVFAVLNTIGRLISGYVSDTYGRPKILMVVFLLQAVNLIFFESYTTPALLVLGTIVTGICYGASFALFPLATADYYGLKHLGGNYGLVFTAWGFAGLLGPLAAGWAVDLTGTYSIAYMLSAATLVVALALVLTMKQKTGGDGRA